MRKIGQIIENARKEKKYSFQKLEEITKIKAPFIEAIEKEDWKLLPTFPIVLGFVKNIAKPLEIDEKMIVAVLKRDYPPKKLTINPKPDVMNKPAWGPKLTFIIGIGIVVALILGYLVFQYVTFISPPRLEITGPIDGQEVSDDSVLVFGKTDTDVKITVNNQPVLIDDDGKFSIKLGVSPETNKITVEAISRSGKTTTIERKIEVQ